MGIHVRTCWVQVSTFVGTGRKRCVVKAVWKFMFLVVRHRFLFLSEQVESQMCGKSCMEIHVSTCSAQISTSVGTGRKPDVW